MTDSTLTPPRLPALWKRVDKAVLAILLIPVVLAILDPAQVWPTLQFAFAAIRRTAPFIAFAVLALGYLKATDAESLLARAFEGRTARMIVLAALVGGLSPFCSCQVIPFVAALLAVGAPLSAVMAFWLSSPLMDPAMFIITSSALGIEFAIGKAAFAVLIGLFGGFATLALSRAALFADPLRPRKTTSCCKSSGCGGGAAFQNKPVWRFWGEAERRQAFREAVLDNVYFLGKWLFLAYMIESLMLRYIPAETVSSVLGGNGAMPVLLAALVGVPAYLNGFAAVPLVDSLMQQGMSAGAGMTFMLAGGISSIPAAMAVWALVKPRVFAAYLGLALTGSILAGAIWNIVA